MLSPVTHPSMLSFGWHHPTSPMRPETTENDEPNDNNRPNENEKETIDLSPQKSRESDATTENDEPNENEQHNQNEETYDNDAPNENQERNQNEEVNSELDAMQNASVNWENTDAEESRITRPSALAANDLRNVLNRRRNQQPRTSQNFVRLSVQNRPDRNIRIVVGNVDEYISSFRNLN